MEHTLEGSGLAGAGARLACHKVVEIAAELMTTCTGKTDVMVQAMHNLPDWRD